MAGELYASGLSAATYYGRVFNASKQVWTGSAFASQSGSTFASSTKVTMTDAESSGVYVGDCPASALATATHFEVRRRVGGSAAASDPVVWFDTLRIDANLTYWLGTAVQTPNTAGVPAVDAVRINNVPAGTAPWGIDAIGTNVVTIGDEVATANAALTSVQAKTDLIPASPAAVGSAMTLAAGAIASASFSAGAIDATAFAQAAADKAWSTTSRTITGGTVTTYTGNTPQTGDAYAIVNNATYGNAHLVRATTPANTLDVSSTGEAGMDWANVGSPTTTLNLSATTVGAVTSVSFSGNGPFSRTVTVTASAVAVPGAIVAMSDGVMTYSATTNASGVATFSLSASTYTLAVAKAGYQHTPASVTVSAAGNTNTTVAAIALTPATDPAETTGYITCKGADGANKANAIIYVQLLNTAAGTAALSHYDDTISGTSDVNGLVQIPGMLRLATYKAKRGSNGDWTKAFITADAGTTPLPEVLGHE